MQTAGSIHGPVRVFFTEQSSTIRALTREICIQYILNRRAAIYRRKTVMVPNCSLFPQTLKSILFKEKDMTHTEKNIYAV
jgi:hypothetical protein